MRLITTEIAKEKGFYAALNGVGLKANWWVGGNPYNNCGEALTNTKQPSKLNISGIREMKKPMPPSLWVKIAPFESPAQNGGDVLRENKSVGLLEFMDGSSCFFIFAP